MLLHCQKGDRYRVRCLDSHIICCIVDGLEEFVCDLIPTAAYQIRQKMASDPSTQSIEGFGVLNPSKK